MSETREQKIDALAEEYASAPNTHDDIVEMAFTAGALAGIRLRDEELSGMAVEFDEQSAREIAAKYDKSTMVSGAGLFYLGMKAQFDRDKAALGKLRAELDHFKKKYGHYVDKWNDKNAECERLRDLLRLAQFEIEHYIIEVPNDKGAINTLEKIKSALGVGDE